MKHVDDKVIIENRPFQRSEGKQTCEQCLMTWAVRSLFNAFIIFSYEGHLKARQDNRGDSQSPKVESGTWDPVAITACELCSSIQSDSSVMLLLGHLFILEANFTCSEERKDF